MIGDPFITTPDPQTWRVVLMPQGTQLAAWIRRADALPPPPPPAGSQAQWSEPPPLQQVQYHTRSLGEVAAIRDALSTPDLWRTQESKNCLDGRTAMVAACVDGRFHAAVHNCDGNEAATRLWDALQKTYPAPRKAD